MGNVCLLELADAHHMICNNVGMERLVKAKATYFKSNRSSSLGIPRLCRSNICNKVGMKAYILLKSLETNHASENVSNLVDFFNRLLPTVLILVRVLIVKLVLKTVIRCSVKQKLSSFENLKCF